VVEETGDVDEQSEVMDVVVVRVGLGVGPM
jgi:hypothetical protein